MTVATPGSQGWHLTAPEPAGPPETLLARLIARAQGLPVALGIDCPIGVPSAYAARHVAAPDFPSFLRSLTNTQGFFTVAAELSACGPGRPFYPARGLRGMTRLAHAEALGFANATMLSRACDRATAERPAGAPLFWTLGANQTGKAAISAWRDMLVPALNSPAPPRLWPFDGAFLGLLAPGTLAVAETYPAEAMRHLGIKPAGSKRRQADRAAYAGPLLRAMATLAATAHPDLVHAMADGFGGGEQGEDQMDSVFGVLCVLGVLQGVRPDTAPDALAIQRWEGWVLGQTALPC
jgi:hypothetical protein